jgi:hypothetical protein
MSLHAQQSQEAVDRYRKQKRNATVLSVVISVATVALVALLMALIVFMPISTKTPVIVAFSPPGTDQQQDLEKKVQVTQRRPQAPPSAAAARVITSAAAAPVAIPTVDVELDTPSLEFGAGVDFGDGLFDSAGDGGAAGGGTMGFGTVGRLSGALVGSLYDFKQNRRGRPTDETNPELYGEIVERIQRRDFSEAALSRYFKAPNELSLTHVAIPNTAASEGPKYFGAEKVMEPKMWLAHYSGDIVALEPGSYRFVGMADDYVSVFIDGEPQLIGRRPDMGDGVLGRWKPAEDSGKWGAPLINLPNVVEVPLAVGDWVEFKAGEKRHIDVSIGERPGGALYFILMVQKKGETYRTASDGRPILPLFTTAPFSDENREEIRKNFSGYELEWDKVPLFPAQ